MEQNHQTSWKIRTLCLIVGGMRTTCSVYLPCGYTGGHCLCQCEYGYARIKHPTISRRYWPPQNGSDLIDKCLHDHISLSHLNMVTPTDSTRQGGAHSAHILAEETFCLEVLPAYHITGRILVGTQKVSSGSTKTRQPLSLQQFCTHIYPLLPSR